MIHEDARVLGLNSYIGEMGGLVMYDLKANDWEYLTGDMPYDPACGLTPHQVIEQTGVCEKILARWPHKIEYHNDMSTGYKYREVTVGMRGDVPDNEVQAILDEAGCGLVWACNGHLTHLSKPTTLELDRVEDGRALTSIPPASTRALPSRASASTWGSSARRRSRSAIPSPTSTWPITWHVLPGREWPDERRCARVPGCLRERFRYARQNCRRLGGDGRAAGRGAFVARRRRTWTCLFERDW